MFSLTRKVSALVSDDWRNLLMLKELRIKIQFPPPFLG